MKQSDTSEDKARDLLASLLRGDEGLSLHCLPWEKLSLLDVAISDRVHLLLAQQLKFRGALVHCPTDIREFLEVAVHVEALNDHARAIELRGVLDRLAQARVCPILLKGFSVAYRCYPEPYLRPRLDIDLLIRKRDVPAVRQV